MIEHLKAIAQWFSRNFAGFLMATLLIWLISVGYLCLNQGPPTWDGGDHSFYALQIHQALAQKDIHYFYEATINQTMWPFLHSWIVAAGIFVVSGSFLTIRLVSFGFALITLLLTGGYAWRYKQAISSGNGSESVGCNRRSFALLAMFLTAGSPMLIIYAVQPMLEIFGAAFTMLTLWLIAESRIRRSFLWWPLLAGGVLTATFFLKYVYALLLIGGLASFYLADLAIHRSRENLRVTLVQATSCFLPVLVGIGLWFSIPSARSGFLVCLDNPHTGFSIINPINWLIYPVTILLYYASSPFLLCLLPSMIPRLFRKNESPFILLALHYTTACVLLLTIYHYKLIRAPFTVIPVLGFLMAASLCEFTLSGFRNRVVQNILFIFAGTAFLVNLCVVIAPGKAIQSVPLWRSEFDYMINTDKSLESTLHEISKRIKSTDNLVIVGEFNEVSSLQLSGFICLQTGERLHRIHSLYAWNQKVEHVDLKKEMLRRGYLRGLILRVQPGSIYDTEDYREKFAWMSQNLVVSSSDSELKRLWSKSWSNGISAELWELSR